MAAAALAAALAFGSVEAAKADISGLTPCSESKGFAKRQKNELKALDKRLKKVRQDSWQLCMNGPESMPCLLQCTLCDVGKTRRPFKRTCSGLI